MSQSRTVQIRRRKQKGKKDLARIARQAKKLRAKNTKPAARAA
jgi:hypothetical protein